MENPFALRDPAKIASEAKWVDVMETNLQSVDLIDSEPDRLELKTLRPGAHDRLHQSGRRAIALAKEESCDVMREE